MNLESTARGIAILVVTGVGVYVLWKGKAAIDAVAQTASDAVDQAKVATNVKAGEADASNWISRSVDAVLFGTEKDAGGNVVGADSLGNWAYRTVQQIQGVQWNVPSGY